MRWTDRLAQLCVCAGVVMLPVAANAATEDDPWEGVNRVIFKFN